ncbi:MAG TPA: hypothetical protein VGW35_11685 [Methylomirabilota bacterium]|nr:hypothetical protein [Methylomirabilota bacterium]
MDVARQAGQMIPERLTETVERYTPRMPSTAYLGIALGAMTLALWAMIGAYLRFSDYHASADRWRRGDMHPPGV